MGNEGMTAPSALLKEAQTLVSAAYSYFESAANNPTPMPGGGVRVTLHPARVFAQIVKLERAHNILSALIVEPPASESERSSCPYNPPVDEGGEW